MGRGARFPSSARCWEQAANKTPIAIIASSGPGLWAARRPMGRSSALLRRSTPAHAVREIADSGSEIGRFVPLHDGSEIVIDEKGWPAFAVRHHQRGLALTAC